MDFTLTNLQFAFFYHKKNLNSADIASDDIKMIFNGAVQIENLPNDIELENFPVLQLESKDKKHSLKGTRLRLDYINNERISLVDNVVPAEHIASVSAVIKKIRTKLPDIKRIGFVLTFEHTSVTDIDTQQLLSANLPSLLSGTFYGASVRILNKDNAGGLNINNNLLLNLSDDRQRIICQRDFNTLDANEYVKALEDHSKIQLFIDNAFEKISLREVSTHF